MGLMTATLIVALDVSTLGEAIALVDRLGAACDFFKVGSELFTSEGPAAIAALRDRGKRVFLDLKLHDIPNTVARTASIASQRGASLLTVHASGGAEMLRAAVAAAGPHCGILAVTVLTSMDAATLARTWAREAVNLREEVVRLSHSALDAGAHGVVCAGPEVSAVRSATGERLATLVPGIRFQDGQAHDQKRIITPFEAARQGATYLVVGRAVTAAADPSMALNRVKDDISRAASELHAGRSHGTPVKN
jgi:orotidine-5'-phosphate decarboxylase